MPITLQPNVLKYKDSDSGEYTGINIVENSTEAVATWLAAHPEATTTVEDGAISYSKLDSSLKSSVDDVANLKTAFTPVEKAAEKSEAFLTVNDFAGNIVKTNVLQVPYEGTDMLDESSILSNGSIATGSTYSAKMVSPLIAITAGTYGLKVVHGNYRLGDIDTANDYDNGFGFFASDGTTVVARPSHLTALGNDIYVIPVPDGASYIRFTIYKGGNGSSYFGWALDYFNQWILLPDADTSITADFFNLGTPKANGTIEKIKRSDGSYLEIKDPVARSFKNVNIGEKVNVSDFLYDDKGYNVAGNNVGDRYTSSMTDNTSCACQVITVEENTKYYIYGVGNPNSFCLYSALDKDKYFLEMDKTSTNYRTTPKEVTPPTGAAYLIINYWNYNPETDFTKKLTTEDVAGVCQKVYRPLNGKTILLLGDSILGNDRYCGVAQYLGFYTGATIINGAIGGTRICGTTRGTSDYTPFDGENLVTAITTGVWTDQDAAAANVVEYVSVQTLPELKAMDLDDVDIVIFNWMANDFTSNTTSAQYKTAYENVVETLLTANPKLRLLSATLEWSWDNNGGTDVAAYSIGNGYDAADCTIEVAGKMHVPVIDMYRNSPICDLTKGVYLDSDKVHLNINGNKLYAKLLANKLNEIV